MPLSIDASQEFIFEDGEFLSNAINLGDSGSLEGVETTSFKKSDVIFRVSIDNTNFRVSADANNKRYFIKELGGNEHRALKGSITKGVKFVKAERKGTNGREVIKAIIRHENFK
jgi:hypothetical protein